MTRQGSSRLCRPLRWLGERFRRYMEGPAHADAYAGRIDITTGDLQPLPPLAWHALAGSRIELGATGFAIDMKLDRPPWIYELVTPEGRTVAFGQHLQLGALKDAAERMQAERAQFVAPATAWKP